MSAPAPETMQPSPGIGIQEVDTLPVVRQSVRGLLQQNPTYQSLDPERRLALARALVKVSHTAAELLKEEIGASEEAGLGGPEIPPDRTVVARPMSAQDEYGGRAVGSLAGTTRSVLNAISFPRFVSELINGVFKALVDANQQQMQAYVELLNQVAASVEGFADRNFGPARARAWLVEQFPGHFELSEDTEDSSWAGADSGWDEEPPEDVTVRLRPGAEMPSEEALRTALGLETSVSIPSGDPEELVPFVRLTAARNKQQMLASMVQMGMQRIVVESGKIHASMRFHVDARSAAESDRSSRFDVSHKSEASGRFGVGAWGASAKITNTIGYVSTSSDRTTEEVSADVGLNSGVELNFRTDYLPLDRMAPEGRAKLIRANTLNPAAEARVASQERQARRQAQARRDEARRKEAAKSVTPTSPAPQPSAPQPKPKPPPPKPKPAPAKTQPAPKTPPPANKQQTNKPASEKPAGKKTVTT